MDEQYNQAAAEVIDAARALSRKGLNVNKSGNVSCRFSLDGRDGMLITPTGLAYDLLTPADIPWMPLAEGAGPGDAIGQMQPSSEWLMHLEAYRRRPDVQAVVHTHSTYATALACQNLPIPPFHYMVAVSGASSIGVVPYTTFGSTELARKAAEALCSASACLLEHHGVLVAGRSLEHALTLASEVENLAHQYVIVRSLGEVRLIEEAEMQKIIEKFVTYGQPRRRGK